MVKKLKAKASKVDAIKSATDWYNECVQAYKACVSEYEVIKNRLTELRLKRDMARAAMNTAHAQKGVMIHSEEVRS